MRGAGSATTRACSTTRSTRNHPQAREESSCERFVYESCVNLGQLNELCDVVLVPEPRTTLAVAFALATLGLLATRSARRATMLAQPPPH
jgi:hypothetical protein